MGAGLGLEPVARGGFGHCEAPLLDDEGAIWFSDVTGGGVFRIAPGAEAIDEVLPGRLGVAGMVLHAGGGVVATGRDVVRVHPDGRTEHVFAADEETGITGFEDCTVDRHGWVLAGALRSRPSSGEAACPGRVVVIAPRFVAVAVDEGVERPGGIGLAPDGTRAYVGDGAHGRVLACEVDRDGALRERAEPWAELPAGASAGGLAVDADGGVWVATGPGGGLVRLDPADATVTAREDAIAPFVSSLAFGGPDGRDVVVTAAGGPDGGEVLRGRAPVAGVPVPLAVV